jgi:hypothetical protein
MTMMPRILCARCGRSVERVECWRDEASCTTRLRVFCHGDQDSMELPWWLLAEDGFAAQIENQQGIAFATARLNPPPGGSRPDQER